MKTIPTGMSAIPWTHYTFNPWWGCEEDSPGCAHCYARHLDKMWQKGAHWGPASLRRHLSEANWKKPFKWAREANQAGERRRVFTLSMGDVFEERDDLIERRRRLFEIVEATGDHLDWLILTKRPQNAQRMTPPHWFDGWPPYAWFGTTIEDTKRQKRRAPYHLAVPARRFLSLEPLLEGVDLAPYREDPSSLEWIIDGGESGGKARAFHLEWAEAHRDIALSLGWAFFMKQLGDNPYYRGEALKGLGRMGKDPSKWPEDLRIQDFPTFRAS